MQRLCNSATSQAFKNYQADTLNFSPLQTIFKCFKAGSVSVSDAIILTACLLAISILDLVSVGALPAALDSSLIRDLAQKTGLKLDYPAVTLFWIFVTSFTLRGMTSFVLSAYVLRFGLSVQKNLRKTIIRQRLAAFQNEQLFGDTGDFILLNQGLTSYISNLLTLTIQCVADLIVASLLLTFVAFMHFETFLLLLITFVVISSIFLLIYRNIVARSGRAENQSNSDYMRSLKEIHSHSDEIIIFRAEELFVKKFDALIETIKSSVLIVKVVALIPKYAFEFALITLFVFFLVVRDVESIDMSIIAELSVIGLLGMRLIPTFRSLVNVTLQLFYQNDTLKRVAQVHLTLEQNILNSSICTNILKDANQATGFESLAAKDLCFSYVKDAENPVIKSLSFYIKNGDFVTICGPSGSGKSTLLELIVGSITPDSGELLLNNKRIEKSDVCNVIGLMRQDPAIFTDTVQNNVTFDDDLDLIGHQKLLKALKLCNCHDFIENLQNGVKTTLDENGSNLSGGQRQVTCACAPGLF